MCKEFQFNFFSIHHNTLDILVASYTNTQNLKDNNEQIGGQRISLPNPPLNFEQGSGKTIIQNTA